MGTRTRQGRLAVAAGVVLGLAIALLAPAESAVAAESLSVNLASVTGRRPVSARASCTG